MGKTNTKLEFLYIVNRLELNIIHNSMSVTGYAFIVLGIFNFAISGNIFTDRMKICLRDFVDLAES